MTFRSRPHLDQARGRDCQVRIPGVCNSNPETTVTAHNSWGDHGMSLKCPDWDSCWACSDCHDVVDGRAHINDYSEESRRWLFDAAKRRTDAIRWSEGLYTVSTHPTPPPRKTKGSTARPKKWVAPREAA